MNKLSKLSPLELLQLVNHVAGMVIEEDAVTHSLCTVFGRNRLTECICVSDLLKFDRYSDR